VRVLSAEFLRSATDPHAGVGWPEEGPPEVAFIGRSNVGKSTLLSALMGRRGLVRISSTPGRTRLINFFEVVLADERAPGGRRALRFVDLPGFGYAKVSKRERGAWFPFVREYLGSRSSLRACVLLVDARRGAEIEELEIEKWVSGRGVEVVPVVTKSDKLAKHERPPTKERVARQLGVPAAKVIMVSATDGDGVGELWRRLAVALARATV
jgi:GTP-binding protein